MAFAPFPPAAYLSDGARTEGEMKTAFENWLLATKQTGGHGQCRLLRTGPTGLWLTPFEGRRMLLNDKSYELPVGGLSITNAGLTASSPYLLALHDDNAGTVSLQLYFLSGAGGATRVVDPDSGISMVSFDNGATISRQTTVVGLVVTDAAAQFTVGGVCGWYGRVLRTEVKPQPADTSGGGATYSALLGLTLAVFKGDTVMAHGSLVVQAQAGVGALVVATGRVGAVGVHSVIWTIPASAQGTLSVPWSVHSDFDGLQYVELGYTVYGGEPVTLTASSFLSATSLG